MSDNKNTLHMRIDEQEPLLPPTKPKKPRTPLPILQITVLSLVQLAEPITSQCIYPFINQLIGGLDIIGGDERKIGYYAGLIESLFFVTEALTILQWSRLSDQIGRKPVILIGMFGLGISMIAFGLSRTFWALVISRCLNGMLNGNIGVMKSMLGELTDSTNRAQALAIIPLVWCLGASIGPFMGGALARPHDRFPDTFSGQFWIDYPYFLPCAASAAFTALCFIVITVLMKETLPSKQNVKQIDNETVERNFHQQQLHPDNDAPPSPLSSSSTITLPQSPPLRSLLIPSVLIPVINFGALAFEEMTILALQPLFYSTPIELGGLGFSPSTIGTWMGLFGLVDGVFEATFFAPIVNRWGPKRVYMFCMFCLIPMYSIFPLMRWAVGIWGVNSFTWFLLSCQMALMIIIEMAFACILMFVTASAPSKLALGAVNGLSQTAGSTARAFAPAMTTSMFAMSIQYNILGGNAVYVFLLVLSVGVLYLASLLPDELEDRD